MAPSPWWVIRDRSAWSWDPSFYAMDTAGLWCRMLLKPRQWASRANTSLNAMAPGIAWLWQFFVPLGRLIGSVELGLIPVAAGSR